MESKTECIIRYIEQPKTTKSNKTEYVTTSQQKQKLRQGINFFVT